MKNMTVIEVLTQLTKKYLMLIKIDHHKIRGMTKTIPIIGLMSIVTISLI